MKFNDNYPIRALRKGGNGEKAWREIERWDHTCSKDKRADIPLVFQAARIDFGALSSRSRTDATRSRVILSTFLNLCS